MFSILIVITNDPIFGTDVVDLFGQTFDPF